MRHESTSGDVRQKNHLDESRYPPKAMDYNKVDDPDAFWKYNVDDATKNNAVMSLDKAEQIGDVIMWLNMIAGNWNDGIGKPKKLREAEAGKVYYIQYGIGKSAKYVVNFHDGVQKHKDGSDFYDMRIFHNKKDLTNFELSLLKDNYKKKQSGER